MDPAARATCVARRTRPCGPPRDKKRTLDMCTLPPGVSDAMKRFYGEYPPTVLVPHSFLPASLQIDRLDEKLARVCRVLQRASGVTLVAERCPLTHKVHAQLRALHNVTTKAAAPFHFYLGGGLFCRHCLTWAHRMI